ncbi:UPF0061-domain-containing protein [Rickenella mellea]|uniref:Selenoprotein O n=1 Tax=Rickenella mellea TaxID=50990 RepID=A0A4Y7PMC6_9AGAM|nr:UPF0061-domain-containing protein [Rickenella mellea]
MSTTKVPISALPLPPRTHIFTQNLNADPATPSAAGFREVLKNNPSVQRRSRLVQATTHFSHVSPLPLQFPYRIAPEEGEEVTDKEAFVERWLSSYEALDERPTVPTPNPGTLKKYSTNKKEMTRLLIGLSDTGLRDCVPHLDVGDAFAEIGPPALDTSIDPPPRRPVSGEDVAVRQELVDVLSGHSVLMAPGEGADQGYAPWSLRYSGHQFGSWAGQLGDGRAISILETPHPTISDVVYELQLKGAGRTPYSRSADGLAVLRSSIREYLCAEAMHALHIPTTRSLALMYLPDLEAYREQIENACVLTRMAPSFVRIGSFEALNPPQNMFFLGGGQQEADWEALRVLGEWVMKRVLKLDVKEGQPWGKKLVMEVARRNARMVAGWQAYGFMHGVMNTDNISVLGLTIDYGPYAFMDIFDHRHVCNHTDEEGRYSYDRQVEMIFYALRALLSSLSQLIGAEADLGKAVSKDWAANASAQKLGEWKLTGMEFQDEIKEEIENVVSAEYMSLMRKRLALRTKGPDDNSKIVQPLLDLMERHKLDFHSTFRRLCFFHPNLLSSESNSSALQKYIATLVGANPDTDTEQAAKDWLTWLDTYASRIESERASWPGGDSEREKAGKSVNPRFVLRQWVLEETIKRVQTDAESGKRVLAKVHEMAVNPYEPWGAEGDETADALLDPEVKEEKRMCGLGAKRFLGFQCSCSS